MTSLDIKDRFMTAKLPIVQKKSLDLHAADALREQIISGAAKSGTRLTEVQLSEQLGLSRGTVRAALQRLVSEGLVEQTPYTGWQVATLSSHDVWELYTLRGSLEGLAGRLAAEKCDAAGAATLTLALRDLKVACDAEDQQAVTNADFVLHKAIVVLSGNDRLLHHYSLVESQVKMIIASTNAGASHYEIYEEHIPIVSTVIANNPDEAESVARWHNESDGKMLAAHIASLSETS